MLNKYLALDVGRVRIGVAVANSVARIAAPLPTLLNDADMLANLVKIMQEQDVTTLIVGLPRGLDGQITDQTEYVEAFIAKIAEQLSVPIVRQDEALTSVKAEAELKQRNKAYEKGDVDSLSAVYILEDYLAEGVH